MAQKHNIVTLGGGTGSYTLLRGLKRYSDVVRISAIVDVCDSGGSTGRLRDEFGVLPVGDFRMALAGLAEERGEHVLRDLFLYRFDKGSGLDGHNFGNLFLVAMTDLLGSEERAIEYAAKVLRVQGDVIPVSNQTLTLLAKYENGEIVRGEVHIDEPPEIHDGTLRIEKLWVEPVEASISEHARDAIQSADCIVLGPGDLYTSTLSNIVVPGVAQALQQTSAKLVNVVNLVTQHGQTSGFTARDMVGECERYMGRRFDSILVNNAPLPKNILARYEARREFPIEDDLGDDARVIRLDLLAAEEVRKPSGDVLKRSFIRHDSMKLADAIMQLL